MHLRKLTEIRGIDENNMINKLFSKIILLVFVCAGNVLASETADSASIGDVGSPMTHRMMVLVFQLGIILLAAKAGHLIFEKLRLPGVLGELCSGMLIGPYALGGITLPLVNIILLQTCA